MRVHKQLKWDKIARKRKETNFEALDEEVPEELARSAEFYKQRIDALVGTASASELSAVIAVVADTLKSTPGGIHLLEQLAIRMELEAKNNIAKMIRDHLPPKGRTPNG